MNKCQEILNKQIKYAEFTENSVVCLDIEIAKGLLGQTKSPTLEEVKQEWEELGYIWKENSSAINLYGKKYGLHILLCKDKKEYFRYDTSNFTFQEHQLLTKTFKALGWM